MVYMGLRPNTITFTCIYLIDTWRSIIQWKMNELVLTEWGAKRELLSHLSLFQNVEVSPYKKYL